MTILETNGSNANARQRGSNCLRAEARRNVRRRLGKAVHSMIAGGLPEALARPSMRHRRNLHFTITRNRRYARKHSCLFYSISSPARRLVVPPTEAKTRLAQIDRPSGGYPGTDQLPLAANENLLSRKGRVGPKRLVAAFDDLHPPTVFEPLGGQVQKHQLALGVDGRG